VKPGHRNAIAPIAALVVAAGTVAVVAPTWRKGSASVDTARIISADSEPGSWLSHGRTYDEQRYSPLDQINETTVSRLGLAWYYSYGGTHGLEGTPLVADGVLYSTGPWSVAVALDAKTGKLLWRYDPGVPRTWAGQVCCDVMSRDPAVYQGKVIIATLDGRLIGLDAKSGQKIWETLAVDNRKWPQPVIGAPCVFNGKVVIGIGGAGPGVRGNVSAYDVNNGRLVWRFWTVPGDPADGAPRDLLVYDPEFNRLYVGVGSGAPWPQELRSEGNARDPFQASIVAVNADTGQYVWHQQIVSGESRDVTATMPVMLADLAIGGRNRKVLMEASSNGFFYVIGRIDGKLISADRLVPNNPAHHIVGAHSWQPMSYNPNTGLVYLPVLESGSIHEQQNHYLPRPLPMIRGASVPPSDATVRAAQRARTGSGWLVAWDPLRQQEAWRVQYGSRGGGGTLSTAGNLVLQGDDEEQLVAYRATDGRKLWSTRIQTDAMAAPITYSIDHEQYIAVNAGTGAPGNTAAARSGGRLLVFKLGAVGQRIARTSPGGIRE